MILCSNEFFLIRHLEEKDQFILQKWLSDPEVLTYYEGRDRPHDIDQIKQHYYLVEDNVQRCIIEYHHLPIGYIQFYLLDDDTKQAYELPREECIYGTDQFIGEPKYWNHGLGRQMLNLMVKFLFTEKHACKIIMDPQTWNLRAIQCYEKVGFKKQKLLPRREWHEGDYRDCWLMTYSSRTCGD